MGREEEDVCGKKMSGEGIVRGDIVRGDVVRGEEGPATGGVGLAAAVMVEPSAGCWSAVGLMLLLLLLPSLPTSL